MERGYQIITDFSPLELTADKGGGTFEPLSAAFELVSFDLHRSVPSEESKLVDMVADRTGQTEGIMRWIQLDFGNGIVFENRPLAISSWDPLLHILPESRSVAAGDRIIVEVSHIHDRLFLIPQAD